MSGRFRRWYGSDPLHLLAMLASFTLAGYAAQRMLAFSTVAVAVWFVGAVIGHDLVLLPLYTLADRPLTALARHRPPARTARYTNYLRVPVALAGLLLLIWFPLIFRLPSSYRSITGRSLDPYFERWLLVSGTFFVLSGVALALAMRRDRRREAAAGT